MEDKNRRTDRDVRTKGDKEGFEEGRVQETETEGQRDREKKWQDKSVSSANQHRAARRYLSVGLGSRTEILKVAIRKGTKKLS